MIINLQLKQRARKCFTYTASRKAGGRFLIISPNCIQIENSFELGETHSRVKLSNHKLTKLILNIYSFSVMYIYCRITMTCNMSSPNPEQEREKQLWQKMEPDASTTGFLSTQESRTAKKSQFVAMSGAIGVIALARKNNPPANG